MTNRLFLTPRVPRRHVAPARDGCVRRAAVQQSRTADRRVAVRRKESPPLHEGRMYFVHHLPQLMALCGAGLFASTIGFAVLWIRARDRATRAESLLEGM